MYVTYAAVIAIFLFNARIHSLVIYDGDDDEK